MNTEKNYEPGKIKEIYDKYAEFLEEKKKLEWIEKEELKKAAEKEIDQVEKLVPGISSPTSPKKKQDVTGTDTEDVEKIINYLFKIVEEKGIMIAVEAVKRMHNPFILDKFHDELIYRGIVK